MASPLLTTKLYIPQMRFDLVARPRLMERLKEGLRRRLTLVSAPAGFGKTTLLIEWHATLSGGEVPLAWVSLDQSDNDPASFWAYVIAALQTLQSGVGENALALMHSSPPVPVETFLTALINEMVAIQEDFVLVLDDYHVIDAQPVHSGIVFLLDHLPQQVHLVIATRADPPLPLARLRASGELLELRASDLRFTPVEASLFFDSVLDARLSVENVAALEKRTEGWIAGIQLAALSMQGQEDLDEFIRVFTGSHRFVIDYLIEEVLNQQAAHVRAFLLKTSILERLTGPLCDAVMERDDGQGMLEKLERANMFLVPLDEERNWFRYHQLFADVLHQRLQDAQPDQVSALHRMASVWHEENGWAEEAIHHALASKDFKRAARLIESVAVLMSRGGHFTTMLHWLEALPEGVRQERPQLNIWYAWTLFLTGRVQDYERPLVEAEQALRARGDEAQLGSVFTVRANVATWQGNAESSITFARQALALLPEDDLFQRSISAMNLGVGYRLSGDVNEARKALVEARALSEKVGNVLGLVLAMVMLGDVQVMASHLHQAADTYREVVQKVGGEPLTPKVGACIGLGNLFWEWDDLDQAEHYLREGIAFGERTGRSPYLVLGYVSLARSLGARGDEEQALAMIDLATAEAQRLDHTWLIQHVEACRVRLKLAGGDTATAIRWATGRRFEPDDEVLYQQEVEYLTWARVLMAQNKMDEAIGLLDGLTEKAEAAGRVGETIEMLALEALAHQSMSNADLSMEALAQALMRAEEGGYVRTFVDEGPPMAALLHRALSRGVTPDYVSRLLAAFGTDEPEGRRTDARRTRPATPLFEPLRERELEVLRLLARGASNQEIAEELVIALTTAKKHVSNIIGKLRVSNRTQAVTQARKLGLL